ncbi:TRAP transporter substrate-binding protein [Kushneria indalinina]|uniref:TRAP-type C4-dicarboxylate transport system substrate-binding protein n=1 Tax=Kushneria indalinina DSM 14324 TaxID=1122140 RepID=A0A3D9DT92_9GAMM|nr:TRAP transporter substrate-binding protein [Kushneria indalinina]REC93956.1 TRAP-type C4-dicarboxylate transport system substrate-binding protein [Kushneria indalinina DSM 14324]
MNCQTINGTARYRALIPLAATVLGIGTVSSASAETSLNVVGSWGSLEMHQKFEQPFWSRTLPEASDGEIMTQVTSFDQMGIANSDVFRYLGDGLFDVGITVGDYTVSDAPELEGLDLPMMTTESDQAREVAEAFRPIAERALNQRFNSHVLAIVPYPAQVLFCNTPISGLSDLEGKKVRGSGRSTGEFLEALGAQSLNIAFNEVPGSLERGVIDCAVTGSMSGYSAGWYDVSSHMLPLPIGGWDYVITAINQDKWESIDVAEQQLIQDQVDDAFTAPVWANAENETQRGIACLTGKGDCPAGDPAGMTLIEPTRADTERARQALQDVVLPAWAGRVDADTLEQWNAGVGQVVDLQAEAP